MGLGGTARAALVAASLTASHTAAAQVLVFCAAAGPEGFDPAPYVSPATFDASARQVYNRLLEFRPGTTEPAAALAESWDISEDGTEYVFRLRRGVRFHDSGSFRPSRAFNADDVLFTFERQSDPDHPYHGYRGGGWPFFQSMRMGELVETVEKIDDHTVRFQLSRPEAPLLAHLAMDFASIHSAEYADALLEAGTPERLDSEPVGTGPFAFVAHHEGILTRFRAFPDHWAGRPAIDELIFAVVPDADERLRRLTTGECHVMARPDRQSLDQLRDDPEVEVLAGHGLDVAYLAYNTRQPPFDDLRVRWALNMAINKQAIIDAVYQDAAMIAKNPIPPSIWAYNHEVRDDRYDPRRARELLSEAGATSLRVRIWAMPVSRPYNPNARRMAELIQADFAHIGVDSEIVTLDWQAYLEQSSAVDRDGAVLLGWIGDNGDPHNFLEPVLSCDRVGGTNRAQWCHPEFDEIIEAARRTTDRETRAALYERAQVIFKRQAPWATIAHSILHVPVRREVTGFVVDPFGGHAFHGVDLAEPVNGALRAPRRGPRPRPDRS